ncbi:anti-sigma-I factor RsgI [Salinibacillus aidingensis]|uniref:Anti-sigma-I factor RsgI n=1 Tax=Salinibacillus aidingensis TaxID=237684 RepID=A0ABN1B5B9_9BACI
MKKGLIVQRKRRHVIVMGADGSFHKTRTKEHYEIGEEIEFNDRSIPFLDSIQALVNIRRVSAAAIILLLIFVPVMMMNQPQEAYAYVNVDINPSIELSVNEDLEVTDLTPINQEARQVLDQLKGWKGQSVELVTHMIINQTRTMGYLSTNHDIFIGISYLKDHKKENRDISAMIRSYVSDQKDDEVTLNTFEVPEQIHQKAQKEEVSMNELYAQEIAKKQSETSNTSDSENEQSDPMESANTSDHEENKRDDQQNNRESQSNKVHQKLIERFIEEKDFIPPGLKKKMDDESTDKGTDKESRASDSENHKEKDSDSKPKDHGEIDSEENEDFIPPGLRKNDKKVPPGHQKNPPGLEKKEEKNHRGPPHQHNNEEDQEWTPPGLR